MKLFQVDAFTDELFGGNPAAVVPLKSWPDDQLLQSIAAENNLAETAYIVPCDGGYELRWFTPGSEVALCGHATLATAHVLLKHLDYKGEVIHFHTRESGILSVSVQKDGQLAMSFPTIEFTASTDVDEVAHALGKRPTTLMSGSYSPDQFDYLAVFNSETEVMNLQPDLAAFKPLLSRGVIATAKSNQCDFVSRYFAPNFGIDEDPVTGSAHCLSAPYWAGVLGKGTLNAKQVSARGGVITCTVDGPRTVLIGQCIDYLQGEILIQEM